NWSLYKTIIVYKIPTGISTTIYCRAINDASRIKLYETPVVHHDITRHTIDHLRAATIDGRETRCAVRSHPFEAAGPSWGNIAVHLGNIGLVGGWGDPPAPETVRKAFESEEHVM